MFQYRQVLARMRLGDTDRAIARAGLMGRRKLAQLRRTAEAAGWLDVATPLPGDPELAVHLGPVRTQPAVASLAEPHRERIERWWRQGIQGTTIHGALVRSHGFTGSQRKPTGHPHGSQGDLRKREHRRQRPGSVQCWRQFIVRFDYPHRIGFVRFVGTHAEYDEVDASTV